MAEHNKDPAYISTGFNNWKKAPKCFKTHENSKCHKAALTNQVTVPKCGDVATPEATPEDHYRSIYFGSLDFITSSIKTRFEQPSSEVFLKLESFLL